jgi:glyoxylase-like metal-dependent hydrolase (beta-lactamase superfamily II)
VNFIFEQIRTGGDRNFGYLIADREAGVAAAVDPSYDPDRFVERARAQGLTIETILNTHGHADHTNGNAALKAATGAPVAGHPGLAVGADVPLEDGAEIAVGSIPVRVYHVPGHCPDHVLFHLPEQKVAVTGDLLFVGKIGGTATEEAARTEWASLQRMLEILPDETTIWPGHDYGCRAASTIGLERIMNPFLACGSIEELLVLKKEWAGFKAEHGLA